MTTRHKEGGHPTAPLSWTLGVLLCNLALAPPAGGVEPVGTAARLILKGKEIYQMYCATCHGTNGAGNGATAVGLVPHPTNFTSRRLMTKRTDAELRDFILDGGGPKHDCPTMPPWASILGEEDVTGMIAYLRTLAR